MPKVIFKGHTFATRGRSVGYAVHGVISIPGWIYIAGSSKDCWYKIGYTTQKDCQKRLLSLKSTLRREGSSLVIDYFKTHKTDDVIHDERALHHTFWSKRLEGEWFELSELDLCYIDSAWDE